MNNENGKRWLKFLLAFVALWAGFLTIERAGGLSTADVRRTAFYEGLRAAFGALVIFLLSFLSPPKK